jgi:bacillithiol biosynthesis cysteine-adding enzyme BshC
MDVACIPFNQTGYFTELITDYLNKDKKLATYYGAFPEKASFKSQIRAKQEEFSGDTRIILNKSLLRQYESADPTEATLNNIELLKSGNTFTIVTGHQLNLFMGPLFFLYKIITVIKLSSALKAAYPEFNFVPVYWMATEDHDFEEINHFTLKGKKLRWNRNSSGAVGHLDTQGLEALYDTFGKEMGPGENAEYLKNLFSEAYLAHKSLSEATRYLVNSLFGKYGLVVVDGDDRDLKRLFIPHMKADILENLPYAKVTESIAGLKKAKDSYSIQVNPREINFFYLQEGIRERIETRNGDYSIVNSKIKFTRKELIEEMETYPERFSPNVITRPLYQEVILPNLCYVGGAGELSYWFELKSMFEAMNVTFPVLMLRNSVLVISAKQGRKLEKLNVEVKDLFLEQNSLINKKIREISNIDIDFSPQRNHLKQQFAGLYTLAGQTDDSFLGAVKAQEVKQLKGLDHLEKRLLKAQKRKLQDHVTRLATLQNELFPARGLQERHQNFSDLYLELGEELIPALLENLQVFPKDFMVLRY